jgi:hypothetical protein
MQADNMQTSINGLKMFCDLQTKFGLNKVNGTQCGVGKWWPLIGGDASVTYVAILKNQIATLYVPRIRKTNLDILLSKNITVTLSP